jgi:tetratricopeptide (TPR) repeat protein
LLAIVGAVSLLVTRRTAPPLPTVNLASVDPTVATTLQRHLEAVRRESRSGPAWGWLGGLLWVYDFRPQAHECLAVAERFDPRDPRWPYYHGLTLMITAPDDAIEAFRRATAICGNTPAAPRIRLARLLAEQGRWEEVRQEADELLKSQPDFTPARLLKARAAQAGGDLKAALEQARLCVDDPRTARSAWALLAVLYRQQGDATAAAQAAERAGTAPLDEGFGDPFEADLTLLRSDPRALTEQAHPLLASGHVGEAARLIDRLMAEHAEFPDTWLLVGRLSLLRKDTATAEKALRRHLELSPNSAQGLFQLGLVLLAQNRLADAAASFQRAIELKPDYGPAHFNRAVALGRAGRRAEAIAAFRESLRHNPEHLETYLLLADLLILSGDPPGALTLLDQAQSIRPNEPRLPALRQRAGQPHR